MFWYIYTMGQIDMIFKVRCSGFLYKKKKINCGQINIESSGETIRIVAIPSTGKDQSNIDLDIGRLIDLSLSFQEALGLIKNMELLLEIKK